MTTHAMTPARTIGLLLVVQMALGPVVNFALLGPVPRALAGAGVGAAPLLVGTALGPLMGGRVVMWLLAPLGLCQIALAGWCLTRGFALVARPQEVRT